MVDNVGRRPDVRIVAVLADVAGLNMRWSFAGGVRSIVAVDTAIRNIRVIEIRREPAHGRVTVIAILTTGNMRWMFARRGAAIVAGAAGADHLHVINSKCGRPDVGVVAVLANVSGQNV